MTKQVRLAYDMSVPSLGSKEEHPDMGKEEHQEMRQEAKGA